jgi:ABC-type polysaccharide/polyol phosphate export permease
MSLIPDQYLSLYQLNPMTLFATAYREVLLNGQLPASGHWIALLLGTLGSLVLGYLPFLRIKKTLAEEV